MVGKITREVLEGYLECRYKGRLRLAGEPGEESDYQKMTAEQEAAARTRAMTHLLARHPEGQACQGATLTAADLGRGLSLFLDTAVEDEQVSLRFDGLVRVEGASRLGDYHYVPVLCQAGLTIRRQARQLLAVLGLVLGAVQGRQPATGLIVRGLECRSTKVKLTTKFNRRANDLLEVLKLMQAGGKAPALTLNEHCRMCEFRNRCHAEATAKDDLSLLRVMGEAELRKQRSKGIFTVTQLSYTFKPRRKGKRAKGESQPHHAALQALAIRDAKTYILGKPDVPSRSVRIYLDLEGGTNATGVYLLGALVVQGNAMQMHSFWADELADEESLLPQLLEIVGEEDCALFHFGSYERTFLRRMRRQARRKGPVDRLLANAVDVLSLIRSNVYFPIHANGLKEIARHLGFAWTDPEASGLQSVVWRRRWEQSRDDSFKQRLLAYNAEDCTALRLITEHLETIAANFDGDGGADARGPAQVERVKASKRGSDFRKWGHTAFLLPEFERASKCAWFDYQRERIVARRRGKKATTVPASKKAARQARPTKRIEVKSNRCPECKSRDVRKSKCRRQTKLFLDLKVSDGGVRRVVVKYTATRHHCRACGRYFLPKKYKQSPRFGHALQCWVVYQHVANRTSFQSLSRTLQECFGLAIRFTDLYRFKLELARRYKGTYDGLLKKIVAGNLLHADETSVQFKKDKGYVWAFASLKNVFYTCRLTRETDFLAPLLKGFTGVLVSDFYKGYDSMPCPQQKCLVHLLRDLNGDLQTSFHDEEFKGLAKGFGVLLEKIVATIDRHGLRRKRLQKHKADVDKFFQDACGKPYQSELAEGYRQRFLKYQDKLFTFLDHDGVPWHNNNAEHAIKHFAKYRMVTNGRVTASGLQPYLMLLSIYQTCVYKNVNFLRFLLSGEQDVDTFAESRRRRRSCVQAQPPPEQPVSQGAEAAEAVDGKGGVAMPTKPRVGQKVLAAIEEIAQKVAAGEDDPRLKWLRGRSRVKILIKRAFPDRAVHGPLLHNALEACLKAAGWVWAFNAVVHTYERCEMGEASRGVGEGDGGVVRGDVVGGLAGHQDG
ncbi:MAG TPA: TM0106 family RecB-like putative nuclease [Gemmataceae bacterium]|nr:TM0106 family RecB-like putative nuclease [Gemmataceae bacterium]